MIILKKKIFINQMHYINMFLSIKTTLNVLNILINLLKKTENTQKTQKTQ